MKIRSLYGGSWYEKIGPLQIVIADRFLESGEPSGDAFCIHVYEGHFTVVYAEIKTTDEFSHFRAAIMRAKILSRYIPCPECNHGTNADDLSDCFRCKGTNRIPQLKKN